MRTPARPSRSQTGRSTPAPTAAVAALRDLVHDARIDTVLLVAVDMQGRLKGKEYDAGVLVERLASGRIRPEMCGYVIGTDLGMTPQATGTFSWESGFGDIALLPHLDRARVLPWEPGTAVVFASPVDGDRPHPLAPATILDSQLDLLEGLGYEVRVGIETEFAVYESTGADAAAAGWRGLRPVTWDNRDYALDRTTTVAGFSRSLRQALAGAGLPVEAVKLESAAGQIEVTFPYGPAREACEQHVLFKHAAKSLADRQKMAATFMAAPADGVGSGMHLHLSIWADGEPVLVSAGDEHALSELGERAVAGLLEVMPATAPMWAPYVNSYKRIGGPFAPSRLAWGRDNRSCAVRVVGHGRGLHLEVRLPGADANPYLALAAAVAAVRHGITGDLKLREASTGDADWDDDLPVVPRHPCYAIEVFETSRVASALLGEHVVAHLASLAHLDVDHHAARVTDAELARGFAQA
ncbi:glutamine synthetase family protein [Kitasatospora aureofaciens]|uniref:glutamine synthetase family protein n=1 Tax=Kitasatospora aureofaciens TaxID=1894 RepID=UPI001C46F8BB|nr:glutamine synthetase family protein [Kitasatospora aureofaciens]MBV6695675.1 glutamine synthetase family protein [Kitasatospora aureofaciens]